MDRWSCCSFIMFQRITEGQHRDFKSRCRISYLQIRYIQSDYTCRFITKDNLLYLLYHECTVLLQNTVKTSHIYTHNNKMIVHGSLYVLVYLICSPDAIYVLKVFLNVNFVMLWPGVGKKVRNSVNFNDFYFSNSSVVRAVLALKLHSS